MEKLSEHEPRFYLAQPVDDIALAAVEDLLGCSDCNVPVLYPAGSNLSGLPLCPKCYVWRMELAAKAADRGFVIG